MLLKLGITKINCWPLSLPTINQSNSQIDTLPLPSYSHCVLIRVSTGLREDLSPTANIISVVSIFGGDSSHKSHSPKRHTFQLKKIQLKATFCAVFVKFNQNNSWLNCVNPSAVTFFPVKSKHWWWLFKSTAKAYESQLNNKWTRIELIYPRFTISGMDWGVEEIREWAAAPSLAEPQSHGWFGHWPVPNPREICPQKSQPMWMNLSVSEVEVIQLKCPHCVQRANCLSGELNLCDIF